MGQCPFAATRISDCQGLLVQFVSNPRFVQFQQLLTTFLTDSKKTLQALMTSSTENAIVNYFQIQTKSDTMTSFQCSLYDILSLEKSHPVYQGFKTFLSDAQAFENFEYFEAAQKLLEMCNSPAISSEWLPPEEFFNKAQMLYTQYISSNSMSQVNLHSSEVTLIEDALSKQGDVFDRFLAIQQGIIIATRSIYMLMATNFFTSFQHTKTFQEWKKTQDLTWNSHKDTKTIGNSFLSTGSLKTLQDCIEYINFEEFLNIVPPNVRLLLSRYNPKELNRITQEIIQDILKNPTKTNIKSILGLRVFRHPLAADVLNLSNLQLLAHSVIIFFNRQNSFFWEEIFEKVGQIVTAEIWDTMWKKQNSKFGIGTLQRPVFEPFIPKLPETKNSINDVEIRVDKNDIFKSPSIENASMTSETDSLGRNSPNPRNPQRSNPNYLGSPMSNPHHKRRSSNSTTNLPGSPKHTKTKSPLRQNLKSDPDDMKRSLTKTSKFSGEDISNDSTGKNIFDGYETGRPLPSGNINGNMSDILKQIWMEVKSQNSSAKITETFIGIARENCPQIFSLWMGLDPQRRHRLITVIVSTLIRIINNPDDKGKIQSLKAYHSKMNITAERLGDFALLTAKTIENLNPAFTSEQKTVWVKAIQEVGRDILTTETVPEIRKPKPPSISNLDQESPSISKLEETTINWNGPPFSEAVHNNIKNVRKHLYKQGNGTIPYSFLQNFFKYFFENKSAAAAAYGSTSLGRKSEVLERWIKLIELSARDWNKAALHLMKTSAKHATLGTPMEIVVTSKEILLRVLEETLGEARFNPTVKKSWSAVMNAMTNQFEDTINTCSTIVERKKAWKKNSKGSDCTLY